MSRRRFLGSLVAFLALSSAAFLLLINRNEDNGMPARVGLFSSSASSSSKSASSIPEGVVYYTNGGFSGGTGHPIFVIDNSKSCKPSILQGITEEANTLEAYIIVGDYGTAVLKTIESVRDELGCNSDKAHPDYCLVVTLNCGSMGDTELSVNIIDDEDLKKMEEVDSEGPTSVIEIKDIIEDTAKTFDLLARADVSDGPLQEPYVLEPVAGGRRDDCGGAVWTDADAKVYHLTIEVGNHTTVADKNGSFQTRMMNGKFFGPLIKINRGEKFRVFFENKLEDIDDLPYNDNCDNMMCKPNHSNLHYHGAHVSGEAPSDDVELSIGPGECYNYESDFPENHMPGTHWIHPHFHGSSTVQVGGGAALPYIVVDDNDSFPIPPEVDTAENVMIFIQSINNNKIKQAIEETYNDAQKGLDRDYFQFDPSDGFNSFRLVNGQYRPSLKIKTGKWYRFRVVYAGWDNSKYNLDWQIPDEKCEQFLLAKDGIYINDYPRKLNKFPVPAAGRADIMVRCTTTGEYNVTSTYNVSIVDEVLMTIESEDEEPPVESLEYPKKFNFSFPEYLQNVVDVEPGENCSCTTDVFRSEYDKNKYRHIIQFGQVIERKLRGIGVHPYHQHVYPFQLTKGFDRENITDTDFPNEGYFLNGDWHDVIRATSDVPVPVIRFNASVHEGKMMLHCHRLFHEDTGMMSKEKISDKKCQCDVNTWVE